MWYRDYMSMNFEGFTLTHPAADPDADGWCGLTDEELTGMMILDPDPLCCWFDHMRQFHSEELARFLIQLPRPS